MSESRISGFYRLDLEARRTLLLDSDRLSTEALASLDPEGGLSPERADKMVENCVGVFGLPVGLALNFQINQRDYLIPMVVEEPSVIAAVSHMAQRLRPHGGFHAEADEGIMIAQIQLVDCPDMEQAEAAIRAAESSLLATADALHPSLRPRGGGARSLELRRFEAPYPMLVVHLLVDCLDAMGANAVNGMAEGLAPHLAALSGGRVWLRILSNLADRRLARARCAIPEEALRSKAGMSGEEVAEGIIQAWRLAEIDPYRAATHNKGIMNGIDAVAIATGNDWRGVEAGAHAYAARSGQYRSLTRWWRENGQLHGELELPLAVGTVGGSTGVHPTVSGLRELLRVETARELAMVMASVGLAQNMGALHALASEGIQRGHMGLHARSLALAAGAESAQEVDQVAAALVARGEVKASVAETLLVALRAKGEETPGERS